MNYNFLYQKRKVLAQKIKDLNERVSALPEGELICAKNGKYVKWYMSDGHVSKYIPRKKREIAISLAQKKYYKCRLVELEQELGALNQYISNLEDISRKTKSLINDEKYIELLYPNLTDRFGEYEEWMNAEYTHNVRYPEGLVYVCNTGKCVRSKSEVIIANALFSHEIPFRYEAELELGEMTVYPDFTIINPLNGEIMYWEHFGLMDSEKYIDNWSSKLNQYAKHGIISGRNLIATYETEKEPLNSNEIENIISIYLT